VKTDVNFLEMAPKGIPEVDKLMDYSKNFGGSTNFNALIIETDSQGLTNPDVIEAIYNLEVEIRETGASVLSIADEIKNFNDIFEGNQLMEKIRDFLRIDKIIFDKIAKNGLVDKDFSKTILVVSFPAKTTVENLEILIDNINGIASHAVIPNNGRVSNLAGQDVVTIEVNKQIMGTQASSTLIELLLILAVLIIGFVSIRIGFLSIVPVLFVLAWEPGSLVLLNIPLNVVNVTVAAIIFSTGIDYGIIIIQRLKEERAKGFSKIEALKTTMETSGLSIVTASSTTMVALLATFAVNIPMLHQFSILVILLYIFSVIASFCILPTVYASKYFK
jgi:predicted RND superfamily exporter protein